MKLVRVLGVEGLAVWFRRRRRLAPGYTYEWCGHYLQAIDQTKTVEGNAMARGYCPTCEDTSWGREVRNGRTQ